MSDKAKSVLAWAIKDRGGIDLTSIQNDRADLIRQINRPAGQRVIRVKITEVAHP